MGFTGEHLADGRSHGIGEGPRLGILDVGLEMSKGGRRNPVNRTGLLPYGETGFDDLERVRDPGAGVRHRFPALGVPPVHMKKGELLQYSHQECPGVEIERGNLDDCEPDWSCSAR